MRQSKRLDIMGNSKATIEVIAKENSEDKIMVLQERLINHPLVKGLVRATDAGEYDSDWDGMEYSMNVIRWYCEEEELRQAWKEVRNG